MSSTRVVALASRESKQLQSQWNVIASHGFLRRESVMTGAYLSEKRMALCSVCYCGITIVLHSQRMVSSSPYRSYDHF